MFQRSQSLPSRYNCFIAGNAPYVGRDSVFLFQNLLRLQHFKHDGAAAKELGSQLRVFLFRSLKAIQTLENALADIFAFRHRGHGQRLVADRQVIEDGFLVHIHALDAILNDDGNFVSECGIVGQQIGHGQCEHMAVAVLMLQAFAGQGGASGGAAEQEAAYRADRPRPRSSRRCAGSRTSSNK